MIRLDMSEISALAADIPPAAEKLVKDARATTIRAGSTIRDAARGSAPSTHTPSYPRSITAKSVGRSPRVTVTVEAQSPFGAILEFGTPTSAALPHMLPAFEAEVPVWLNFLDQAVREFLS